MAKDKVKCEGCGSMVWVGAKMYDGYCHDCYKRGRHLPPDEDDWLQPAKKKKSSPTASRPAPASSAYTPSLWTKMRSFITRYKKLLIPVLIIIVFINALRFGEILYQNTPRGGGSPSDEVSAPAGDDTNLAPSIDAANGSATGNPFEQTLPPPIVPVRIIEESYCFVLQPWMLTVNGEIGIKYAAVFNMVRDGEVVKSVIAALPDIATHENADNEYWEDIIVKAAVELGDIKYLLFRRCSINLSTINREILPDTIWCATISDIDYNEPFREVSIGILGDLDVHFAGFRGDARNEEQFFQALKEHMGKFGVADIVVIR